MTNEHQSVEQLYEVALGLPPAQRDEFLERACSGSPTLRRLLEQLLEEQRLPVSFLGQPIVQAHGHSSTLTSSLPLSLGGPPRFGSDDVIGGRFRVVRFIAQGGMGEVYEVQDRFLQATSSALKIIRPHIAADPHSSRRFEQEVLLARRVNHRNLCPIYDIFHCDQPAPPFLFLTMKLLAGESLQARLKRPEGIPLEEGIRICGQLMEGIKAIHSVGIIHRDIKPNNVMLEQSGSEICVTIMDFGLARLSEPDASLSRIGLIAGTPGYLAPELMQGASPSPASDLYALGVVLHQVLTGERPTPSMNGRASTVASGLDQLKAPAALVQAVNEFLSEDPERRCRAFKQMVDPAEAGVERTKPFLLTRRNFAFGGAATLCALGGGAVWKWPQINDSLHPLPAKRFVALLNWPPPSDAKITPILLGVIDTMVNVLSRAEAFDRDFFVACQSSLTEMKTSQQVNDVCESLGANLILATSGSLTADGILLVLQVIAKDSSKILRSRNLHVPSGERFALPTMATRAAAQLLNVSALPANAPPNQLDTKSYEALANFQAAEALMKEPNNGGLNAAIEKYKSAVEADPRFANAHARLAFAYYRLFSVNHDSSALMLSRANADTALALDPECVEGHAALASVYQETGAPSEALREYAKALAPDPSNSSIIVRQAKVYFDLNRWQEAEEACRRVLKARPNFWEPYNGLGSIYNFQGKYQKALEAFQAASVTAPRNAFTVANSAYMLFLLGNLEQAEAMVAKSIALAPLPWAFDVRADIRRAQGKFAESVQAALTATTMDPEGDIGWLRAGDAYARMKHREKEAADSYRRALASKVEQLKVNQSQADDWIQLALYQAKTGDKTSAGASIKKADELQVVDIYSLVFKVRVLALLGLSTEALETLAKCVQMGATPTQIQSTNDLESLTSKAETSSAAGQLTSSTS